MRDHASDPVAQAEAFVLVLGAAGSAGGTISLDHLGGRPAHMVSERLFAVGGVEPSVGGSAASQLTNATPALRYAVRVS
ncbi:MULTISPECIES: hypothetical protein [unclassified Frankia]